MSKKLGEICKFQSGGTPAKGKAEYFNGQIPWVTTTALTGGFIDEDDATDWITDRAITETAAKIVPANSIMVGTRVGVGKVAINKVDMSTSQDIISLVDINDNLWDKNYLCKFIQEKSAYLNSQARGATIKGIKIDVLSNLYIPDITVEKQKHVAKVLDTVIAIITDRKSELEMLDELIKARFVEIFGDLKLNPKGWKIQSFEELSELITDGEHATPKRAAEGIYLLSARNVLNHAIQLDDVDYIDQEEYDRISRRIVPREGDVLISCSGSVGRCCSVPAGLKFQMVRSAALVRFKRELTPIFAEYMITSDFVQEQINTAKTASSQANLFQGKIAKLKGIAPPIELQEQFVTFVKEVDKSKVAVQKSLDETQLLFDCLMQEYFG